MVKILTIEKSQELFDLGIKRELATGTDGDKQVFTLDDIIGLLQKEILAEFYVLGCNIIEDFSLDIAVESFNKYDGYEDEMGIPISLVYYSVAGYRKGDEWLVRFQGHDVIGVTYDLVLWCIKKGYIKQDKYESKN